MTSAFKIRAEVVERGAARDASVSVRAVGTAVGQFAGVEEPDEGRARHADQLGGFLGGEVGRLVGKHVGHSCLEGFDDIGAEFDLTPAGVDQAYVPAEQREQLFKFSGVPPLHAGYA